MVARMVGSLREKPLRIAYVLAIFLGTLILFSLAEFLPAPYEF